MIRAISFGKVTQVKPPEDVHAKNFSFEGRTFYVTNEGDPDLDTYEVQFNAINSLGYGLSFTQSAQTDHSLTFIHHLYDLQEQFAYKDPVYAEEKHNQEVAQIKTWQKGNLLQRLLAGLYVKFLGLPTKPNSPEET